MVELFHPEHLVVSEVVVINVSEPVPVLRRRNLAHFLVLLIEELVQTVRARIQFFLHRHDQQGLPLLHLLSLLQYLAHFYFY